jgi:hypothetical protein
MKKIFAIAALALAFVATAFAGTTFNDPNGATTFTQYTNGVQASNISNATVNVRFVQPGLEFNLTLAPGEGRFFSGDGSFYEWTCPVGYWAVIPGTNALPTYANRNTTANCR